MKLYTIAKQILTEKKLRAFDFDHTLATVHNFVYISKPDGTELKLDPAQYGAYVLKPGEKEDFRDFNSVRGGKLITHNISQLISVLKASGRDRRTVILTARANPKPIYDFLLKHGIRIPVITVAGSNPKLKADWVEAQINAGYDDIMFIDDVPANLAAIGNLKKKYPKVKIVTKLAKH